MPKRYVYQLSQAKTKENGLFKKQNAHISENCSLECALQLHYKNQHNFRYYFVKLQKTREGVEHETNMGLKKCIYFKVLEEL
jgi:hypothetical protein